MPAALPADWPSIRTLAAQGSTLEELVELTGISLNTLKARSAREGWKVKAKEATEERQSRAVAVAVSKGQMQQNATAGIDMVANTLAERHRDTRLGLSKWAKTSSAHLATLEGEEALAAHQPAVGVASVMGKLWPEQGNPTIRLSMFAGNAQQPVEIEAEFVPDGECGTAVEPASTQHSQE